MEPPVDAARLTVVTPVYDDWASFAKLMVDLGDVLTTMGMTADVLAVDDCSPTPGPSSAPNVPGIARLRIIRLGANVGHQRAIAIGLMRVAGEAPAGRIVVMDSDGEDRPAEIPGILAAAAANPTCVIVAQRHRRSEGPMFRFFYQLYLRLFSLLTGHRIRFGNFLSLSHDHIRRIVNNPHIWNNFAATVVQSRLPIRYIPTIRGRRYEGQSKMNFVGLVAHGLGAIAVFSDAVFIRILIASTVVFMASAGAALTAVMLRLFAAYTFPGWATNVMGFAVIISIQAILTPILVAFLLLSNRASVQALPRTIALTFIEEERAVAMSG